MNPPGGSGPSGWNLKQGDRFYVADIRRRPRRAGRRQPERAVDRHPARVKRRPQRRLDQERLGQPPRPQRRQRVGPQAGRPVLRRRHRRRRPRRSRSSSAPTVNSSLLKDNGGLSGELIKNDSVNHPGGSDSASGWNLNQADRFFVADIDGDDRDELIVVSGNGQWSASCGRKRRPRSRLDQKRLGQPPRRQRRQRLGPQTGRSVLRRRHRRRYPRRGDRDRPNGQWIGILREDNGGLSAGWIKNDWVNHPGGSGASGWDLRQGTGCSLRHRRRQPQRARGRLAGRTVDRGIDEAGGGLEATWLADDG